MSGNFSWTVSTKKCINVSFLSAVFVSSNCNRINTQQKYKNMHEKKNKIYISFHILSQYEESRIRNIHFLHINVSTCMSKLSTFKSKLLSIDVRIKNFQFQQKIKCSSLKISESKFSVFI